MSPLRRLMVAGTAALMMGLMTASVGASAAVKPGAGPSAEQVDGGIQGRETFGLRADEAFVRALIGSAEDVGSAESGLPMTAEESALVDLSGRAAFVQSLEAEVLPHVRSLSTHAGVWIDQVDGGSLVVVLTEADPEVEQGIRSLMPERSLGLRFDYARHTHVELLEALDQARPAWSTIEPSVRPEGFALDERENRLRMEVLAEDSAAAAERLTELEAAIGVDVDLLTVEPSSDVACSTRNDCHAPLEAGVRVRQGSLGGSSCTMGFHIWVPSSSGSSNPNTQFLTAGHCGFAGANDWFHAGVGGDGLIGWEKATLYDDSYARDIMRVGVGQGVAAAEMSRLIYGEANTDVVLYESAYPVLNEVLCMSLGQQDFIGCGIVGDTDRDWLSDTPNPDRTVHGAAIDTFGNFTSIDGDSGSPIYRDLGWQGSSFEYTPIGILDAERTGTHGNHDIYFAKVRKALEIWDAEIWPD